MDILSRVRPGRRIDGISATLLPYNAAGEIDWPGFAAHLVRTAECGLTPAVNMDTGYGPLLSPEERVAVLDATRSALGGRPFVAGAVVADRPGTGYDPDAYLREIGGIVGRGGTPVVCQSFGLTALPDAELLAAYDRLGRDCEKFIAFELGEMFAPFGRIYSAEVYRGLLGITKCAGAKHSSLRRDLEWDRLALRDATRPDFKVYTGNDLAIDMVMYGSDYLLGLSTFAPEAFAARDKFWLSGDRRFYECDDLLQYLGFFAFRPPVPAYKHSAAMLLALRGRIGCDATHPRSPTRPDSDRVILADLADRLAAYDRVT